MNKYFAFLTKEEEAEIIVVGEMNKNWSEVAGGCQITGPT